MTQRIKLLIAVAVSNLVLVFGAGAGMVAAQTTAPIECGAIGNINASTGCAVENADEKIQNTIKRAIQIFQIIVGLISVFMLIFGGLKYITSGGSTEGIQGAKNTILYAAIGLIVVALAQVIVQFVLNRATQAGTPV